MDNDLISKIREIPNFPTKGINFKDATPLFQDRGAFAIAMDKLAEPYLNQKLNQKIDAVVGIGDRGFLLAPVLAYKLGAGLVITRKKGKLPHKKIQKKYKLEYGTDTMEIHRDAIKPKQKVLIVDDILCSGGTARTCADLVERLGGKIIGFSFLMEDAFSKGREKLKGYKIHSLIKY